MAEGGDEFLNTEVEELMSMRKISHMKEARVLAKLEQVVVTQRREVEDLECRIRLLEQHRDMLISEYSAELAATQLEQNSKRERQQNRKDASFTNEEAYDRKQLILSEKKDIQLSPSQTDAPSAIPKSEGPDVQHMLKADEPAACVESHGKVLVLKKLKRPSLKTCLSKPEKKKRKLVSRNSSSLSLGPALEVVCSKSMQQDLEGNAGGPSDQVLQVGEDAACANSIGSRGKLGESGCVGMSSGTHAEAVSRGANNSSFQSKGEASSSLSDGMGDGSCLVLPEKKPGQLFDQAVLSLQGLLDRSGNIDTTSVLRDELPVSFASCDEYKARLLPLVIEECKAMISCWEEAKNQIKQKMSQTLSLQESSMDSSRDGLISWELRCLESKGVFREVEVKRVRGGPQKLLRNDLVLIVMPPVCMVRLAIVHHHKPLVILRMREDTDSNIKNCFIRPVGNITHLKHIYKAILNMDTIADPLKLQMLNPTVNDSLLMSIPHSVETEHSLPVSSRIFTSWLVASRFTAHQLRAINALLQLSQGFLLVQGPPGTGKTSTISGMVSAQLIKQPLSKVLICAPSNGALDEIALTLSQSMLDVDGKPYVPRSGEIVRLGRTASIREACKGFSPSALVLKGCSDITEENIIHKAKIIFATLSGCGHYCMKKLDAKFDLVILDEAVQAVEAEALIALRKAKTICVLLGDPCQLPARVLQCPGHAYRRSLFERLEGAGLPAHILEIQYRMNPAISSYPSRRFYDGRLQNHLQKEVHMDTFFKPEAIRQGIKCSGGYKFKPLHYCFLGYAVRDNIDHSHFNSQQARTVCSIVLGVFNNLKPGVNVEIGIIAASAQQQQLIKKQLDEKSNYITLSMFEVGTVYDFQGREKDIVILSCGPAVPGEGCGFLLDERRINVALTRARHMLVMIGHAKSLQKESVFWKHLIDDAWSRCFFQNLRKKFPKKKDDKKSRDPACKKGRPGVIAQYHTIPSENNAVMLDGYRECGWNPLTTYPSSRMGFGSMPCSTYVQEGRVDVCNEGSFYTANPQAPLWFQPSLQNVQPKDLMEYPRCDDFQGGSGCHSGTIRTRFSLQWRRQI